MIVHMINAEDRIIELGLSLPPPPPPGGVYKPVVVIGSVAYVSGHGPLLDTGELITGRLGETMEVDEGKAAARQTGLALLATLKDQLGTLNRIQRILKLLGMVNATPEFGSHPQVINGCSELFRDIWGDDGVGARSAVGMGSLPGGIAVEIEAILELRAE